jgi:ribonucleoside-diphosphate reductase alpha chain
MDNFTMRVTKRCGSLEEIAFDKILNRIKKLGQEANIHINYQQLVMKVIDQLYDTISTTKIDELAAEQCASMSTLNPDYGILAGRIIVSNHQKNTDNIFYNVIKELYNFVDIHGNNYPLVNQKLWDFVQTYKNEINSMINYDRDYLIDYFGFKTLERSYLFKKHDKIIERPQHMWMRVSIGIHGQQINEKSLALVKETYDLMSLKYFTHATPTLFNAGTPRSQLSSCYLIAMEEDSIQGIYNTLKDCALISKYSGGIGLHIHNIRGKDSHIKGTNGKTDGLVPMLRVFNNTARYVNQSGRRNGSFAIYLEPWHSDIFEFLELRKNHGDEELKARDLFYALWMPDLFMERVKETNGKWSLFCPNECPGLSDVYGDDFVKLYEKYEQQGKARKTILARDLWFAILDAQMETGNPYILYKDACNKKSNQKNIGTIKSSNLCVAPETLILTDKGHLEISSLVGQDVNVWNGQEWSLVTIMKTGEDQELIDIHLDDGSKLSCTPYHKFYIQNNYSNNSIEKVEAKDLKPYDKIIKCEYPVIDGNESMPYAYTHGFFCGDGTYGNKSDNPESSCKFKALPNHYFCKRHLAYETEKYLFDNEYLLEDTVIECQAMSYVKKPVIYLYGDKKKLIEFIDKRSYSLNEPSNRIDVSLPVDLNEKFDVPSNFCSIKDKLDWFAGYCDAVGNICKNGENEQLQVTSINKEFLHNVKLLLQTCGINPKIKLSCDRKQSYLPDGKGGYKYFDVHPIYRLLITSCDLYNLYQLGFSPKRLIISGNKPSIDAKQFIKILKVENNNRIDDTYCFTEPKRNMGIFNGIITGQCTEIIQFSDDKETAVCNLASIALPAFVNEETKQFDYDKLHEITKVVANNLNQVIDINFYPTEKTKLSNFRHRPIGIGVQGLADAFILMDLPFHSEEAKEINKNIFETIYHAALEKSNEISKERTIFMKELKEKDRFSVLEFIPQEEYDSFTLREKNENINLLGAYSSFEGSPASKGILQFDMWNVTPSNRYDWEKLKQSIIENGLRNSLLIAPMPTASTSQILGYNECFEPLTSNIYSRRTLAGEFVVVNKYLMKELINLELWNEQIKNNIIANKGSVQQLTNIPQHIRDKYKIVWEIPMKHLIDMAADRGAFICQSQSLNLWMEDPVYNKLTSMHFYAWNKGLKTGIYYLRRKAKHQAQQFTIEPENRNKLNDGLKEEICEMCSA